MNKTKDQTELLCEVFKNLEAGMSLKKAATSAYRKYGNMEFPLVSYSLTASKNEVEMLKLKIQKHNGYSTIGLSRDAYELMKANSTNLS